MYHKSNEEDPYITMGDLDNEELEDFMIRPTDDVILSAVMEEDGWSHLDVCILPDNEDASLFVHHDYMLPAFPLCVAWVPPNVAAVGTFHPEIELWDLNVVDTPEPEAKLEGHTDAVLGLAAHPMHHQMLASASADCTVRLWDIATQQTVLTMTHHKTKVQSLAWSPANSETAHQGLLASGGFDQRACVLDVRQHEQVTSINLDADVEALRWSVSRDGDIPTLFVSTETGEIVCYDLVAGKRRWTLSAHVGAPCSSFSLYQSPFGGPTLLATSSPDSSTPLKLWTIQDGRGPACIYQKTASFGRLHSVAFSQERPFHLALGGHEKHPHIVNILELAEVQRAFSQVGISMPAIQSSLRSMATAEDKDGESDEESETKGPAHRNTMETDDVDQEDDMDTDPTPQRRTKASYATSSKYLPKKKSLGASKKKKH
jgi:periodic tryptophan protein 1